MTWVTIAVSVVAAVPAFLRWWRVAQREHYLAPAATRFAGRWWLRTPPNQAVLGVAVAGAVLAWWWTPAAWVGSIVAGAGPIGLGIKGRTSSLAWTGRMKKVAAVSSLVFLGAAGLGTWVDAGLATLAVVLVPVWVDAALAVLAPLERHAGNRWVEQAATALERSGSQVVAITGSYGKTSTKVIAAHLLSGVAPTVASPASFNNRMGLARAINEGLAPGTQVFIAEMGTYGPGEIAELCSWIPPDVAVMTAIGPVHLERMGSERRIAEAKREILANATVGVINVDHPLLAEIAREESPRIRIVTCSTEREDADVYVDRRSGRVRAGGEALGVDVDLSSAHAGNVACAIGVVLGLGVDPQSVSSRIGDIPVPPNRQTTSRSAAGFAIIDDTFNSNPAGAKAALERLVATGAERLVMVTPGMVELGRIQDQENRELARHAAGVLTDLVVVGRTNRRALIAGATEGGLTSVIVKRTREDAVAWVREELGPHDAVLYENDLPDHYP